MPQQPGRNREAGDHGEEPDQATVEQTARCRLDGGIEAALQPPLLFPIELLVRQSVRSRISTSKVSR